MRTFITPLILLLAACSDSGVESNLPSDNPIKSVKYVIAEPESYQQIRQFGGEVKSATTSPLSFKVSGTIDRVLVNKGEFVEQGQLLAVLDSEEFELALDKAKAALGSASAAQFQSLDQYERALKLQKKGFVSDSELLSIKADLDAKTQQVNVARTDVNNAELSLSRTSLYAPFTGQLSTVNYDDYTKISAGSTVLELISSNAYQVDFLVPESLIQEVQFKERLEIEVPALNHYKIEGVVTEIGAVVEKGNAYSVTIMLEDSTAKLRNGMSASVQFPLGEFKDSVVTLPLTAFDFGDYSAAGEESNAAIFVIDDEMKLVKRYVKVLKNINSEVVVLSNLNEGERVVVAGVPYLYERQQVSLWTGI